MAKDYAGKLVFALANKADEKWTFSGSLSLPYPSQAQTYHDSHTYFYKIYRSKRVLIHLLIHPSITRYLFHIINDVCLFRCLFVCLFVCSLDYGLPDLEGKREVGVALKAGDWHYAMKDYAFSADKMRAFVVEYLAGKLVGKEKVQPDYRYVDAVF